MFIDIHRNAFYLLAHCINDIMHIINENGIYSILILVLHLASFLHALPFQSLDFWKMQNNLIATLEELGLIFSPTEFEPWLD